MNATDTARTELSEDQKGEACTMEMLLEAEPAFCLSHMSAMSFLFSFSPALHSLTCHPISFLPLLCLVSALSVVLHTVLSWEFSSCLKGGQSSDPCPFLGDLVGVGLWGLEQLLEDRFNSSCAIYYLCDIGQISCLYFPNY